MAAHLFDDPQPTKLDSELRYVDIGKNVRRDLDLDGDIATRLGHISSIALRTRAAKGKLTLALEPVDWLSRAERAPGISFLRPDRQLLVQSARLPGEIQGDPADRILIATALAHQCWLVTADEAILRRQRRRSATCAPSTCGGETGGRDRRSVPSLTVRVRRGRTWMGRSGPRRTGTGERGKS